MRWERSKALLTPDEAVSTGYITQAQIYDRNRNGVNVPVRKIGSRVLIPKAEFIEFLCVDTQEKPI